MKELRARAADPSLEPERGREADHHSFADDQRVLEHFEARYDAAAGGRDKDCQELEPDRAGLEDPELGVRAVEALRRALEEAGEEARVSGKGLVRFAP